MVHSLWRGRGVGEGGRLEQERLDGVDHGVDQWVKMVPDLQPDLLVEGRRGMVIYWGWLGRLRSSGFLVDLHLLVGLYGVLIGLCGVFLIGL